MSHFTVLVVTDEEPDDAILSAALQPFHEFECTGTDDQYIQDIDITEEQKADWEQHKEAYPDFIQYLKDYEGKPATMSPDLKGEHKYGYALLDASGNVTKVIDRTNPNKEWDWWVVGGRWSDKLLTKSGKRCDMARKGDVDFEGIRIQKSKDAADDYDKITAILTAAGVKNEWHKWEHVREVMFSGDIDAARTFYHAQPGIKALSEARIWDDADGYLQSREAFIAEAEKLSFSTFAVLKDGKWSERGDMGWWGCVSDEKDSDAWNVEFSDVLNSIRDDQWLTIVDCHI